MRLLRGHRGEKREEEAGRKVRSVVTYANSSKISLGWGRRRRRWFGGFRLGLDWRTTALIADDPYAEQGKGWKEQIR